MLLWPKIICWPDGHDGCVWCLNINRGEGIKGWELDLVHGFYCLFWYFARLSSSSVFGCVCPFFCTLLLQCWCFLTGCPHERWARWWRSWGSFQSSRCSGLNLKLSGTPSGTIRALSAWTLTRETPHLPERIYKPEDATTNLSSKSLWLLDRIKIWQAEWSLLLVSTVKSEEGGISYSLKQLIWVFSRTPKLLLHQTFN